MIDPIHHLTDSFESTVSPALERRAIHNEGGFLTPYYLFDLMGRRHAEELDPVGRETNRLPLKRIFQQAQKVITGLAGTPISFERTWSLWYQPLFETLGFPSLTRLAEPVMTARHGLVPISHACFLPDQTDEEPLIFLDLHPFGTDLDRARYPHPDHNAPLTTEPISRAIEFALDENQTRWLLLSNGLELRLYRQGGTVARQYLKVDFVSLFGEEYTKDWFVFWGVFRFGAFLPTIAEGQTETKSFTSTTPPCLLDQVIDESQRHATKIADDLRDNIVRAVEYLVQGLIDSPNNSHTWEGSFQGKKTPNEAQLKTLFEESVYFLYRLLFVLYAESRDLLPVGESRIYHDTYSLEHLREMAEKPLRVEDYEKTYYTQTLHTLFKMLSQGYPARHLSASSEPGTRAKGSTAFRIPPYNGRLFDPERTKLLDHCVIPDRAMREVIRELSLSHPKRRGEQKERYSYADLGIDQLGSIYEGLLVYEPAIAEQTMVEAKLKGDVRLIPQDQADELDLPYDEMTRKPAGSFYLRIWGGRRKGSGSYYTPQEITAFLVKDALTPLVEPIIEGCAKRDEQGNPLRTADEILKIKVCDPAMGSGAFLVQACRFLGEAYGRAIVAEEQRENTRITSKELAKYKRRVAEKCLYGVDLNPLAVELAKVSLWLETLAQDRPLTFLDAHLRCGNALIGVPLRNQQGDFDPGRLTILPTEALGKATKEDTGEFKERLKKLIQQNRKQVKKLESGQLVLLDLEKEREALTQYEQQRFLMEESDENKSLEEAVDLVHQKQRLLQEALTGEQSAICRLKKICDLWCSVWFWPVDAKVLPPTALTYHDLVNLILQQPGFHVPENASLYLDIATQLAEKELHFFHWELEFPEVWFDEEGNALEKGGFDVMVANPPWDTILLNSKEFWSNYLPTFRALGKQEAIRIAKEVRSDSEIDLHWRKYFKQIYQYNNAFKLGKFYSWQGSGALNTYKLFLEQIVKLTKVSGIFSIVIPSGIYTDEGCTDLRRLLFFQQNNRYLVSLENRKGIFPIHSSFKVVLFSGEKQKEIFFKALSDENVDQIARCLFLIGKGSSGDDLSLSKAELGIFLLHFERHLLQIPAQIIKKLAPDIFSLTEFKNQREIDLFIKLYEHHPLLSQKLENAWNIITQREFHMTDDSHLFHEKPNGWPLWEGKMIYQFACDYNKPRYWIEQRAGSNEIARRAGLKNYVLPNQWEATEPKLGCTDFRLVYRKVASNTNEVTLIVAILPPYNFIGNSIDEFLQWRFEAQQTTWTKYLNESHKLFLASILNSFVANFIIRQKVSANISMYLLGQLPVPRLLDTHQLSRELITLAAKLTCVDERFAPIWGTVVVRSSLSLDPHWKPEYAIRDFHTRAQLRATIDAIVADLYGVTEHDFAYILSTFPLLDRDQPPLPDEDRSFITRDLVLLTLFTKRGIAPPTDIVSFFAEAGVAIRQRTGPIRDLTERVRFATQELGAVAYLPTQREKEGNNEEHDTLEQDELDFYDEE